MTDRVLGLLATSLGHNKSLKELILANNKISEYGMTPLAELIKNTSTLENISLHWNNIRGVGAY